MGHLTSARLGFVLVGALVFAAPACSDGDSAGGGPKAGAGGKAGSGAGGASGGRAGASSGGSGGSSGNNAGAGEAGEAQGGETSGGGRGGSGGNGAGGRAGAGGTRGGGAGDGGTGGSSGAAGEGGEGGDPDPVRDPRCDQATTDALVGSGTVGDPFLVCLPAHLALIDSGNYTLASFYELGDDLDLTELGAPLGSIGAGSGAFAGTFDGRGHRISGVEAPLFDLVDTGGSVRGLSLFGEADASDQAFGWGFLTHINSGTISDVQVSADVALPDHGGLLVGNNRGTIEDSSTTGVIISGGNHVGGLIGVNENGLVRRSWSTVTVNGARRVGGLVGRQSGTATVEQSFALGAVAGSNGSVGGLIGTLFGGSVRDCYARTPSVTSPDAAAGLVGELSGTAIVIENSYATALALTSTNPEGLIGFVEASSDYMVTSSYFLDTQPGTRGTALSDGEMRVESSFSGWDFATVWKFDGALSPYPSLAFE